MKSKKSGFTMVELLTVLAIIAILVALLVPALALVRKITKETQQRAQLNAIELAMTAFKNDYGDYPPSDWPTPDTGDNDYCGAQKLAEALLGRDLLGFHPESNWDATDETFYPDNLDPDIEADKANLDARRGPYLDVTTANAFKLGDDAGKENGLFDNPGYLEQDTFVICDVFGVKKVTIGKNSYKAGTPILYYKADPSSKKFEPGLFDKQIYDAYDNWALIRLGRLVDGQPHKLADDDYEYFYDPDYKIVDPKVTAMPWPHRPDSYILISAGADGEYGTEDDICNF